MTHEHACVVLTSEEVVDSAAQRKHGCISLLTRFHSSRDGVSTMCPARCIGVFGQGEGGAAKKVKMEDESSKIDWEDAAKKGKVKLLYVQHVRRAHLLAMLSYIRQFHRVLPSTK